MEISEIKERLSISTVALHYGAKATKYKYRFSCWRHSDNNPSLLLNDDKGIANCMGSGCEIRAMDIFNIIQLETGYNFHEAKKEALRILGQGDIQPEPHQKKPTKKPTQNNYAQIPPLKPLNPYHREFLKNRYGKLLQSVLDTFKPLSYAFHVAIPIGNGSYVFIPTQKKDCVYYKGKYRNCQVFPYFGNMVLNARNILVCEGEKDVMMLTAFLKPKGKDWSVITNTNGAGSLKEGFSLFANFNKEFTKRVILAYDNDQVGRRANSIAYELAKQHFTNARISTFQFPQAAKEKYDMSDYIREKYPQLFQVI